MDRQARPQEGEGSFRSASISHTTRQNSQPGALPPPISYLPYSSDAHLALVKGDPNTFADVLGLISQYESVLERNESLAAKLGARLTGPRLLKGIDNFFDGQPRVLNGPRTSSSSSVSWLEVVLHAKRNPSEFSVQSVEDGHRACRFWLRERGLEVEITEDDWRLISSGALSRLPLDDPLEGDELAEMATLEILEQRTSVLYKKADEIAARARILNHKLGSRRQAIRRRRKELEDANPSHSQQQFSHPAHQGYDLHADLLQQFASASASASRTTSEAGHPVSPIGQSVPSLNSPVPQRTSDHQGPHSPGSSQEQTQGNLDVNRHLMTQWTDRLSKGDIIDPPCDRCRRLRYMCVKHLTACQGCTKKHARCGWKAVTEAELERVRQEMGHSLNSAAANVDADPCHIARRDGHQGSALDQERRGEQTVTGRLNSSNQEGPSEQTVDVHLGPQPTNSQVHGL